MQVAAGVGLELRKIYLLGRRSHHSNDAPQQTSPNYRTEEQGPLPLLPPERQEEGEGQKAHAGGDVIYCPPPEREERGKTVRT
jgi:hypothetical protein